MFSAHCRGCAEIGAKIRNQGISSRCGKLIVPNPHFRIVPVMRNNRRVALLTESLHSDIPRQRGRKRLAVFQAQLPASIWCADPDPRWQGAIRIAPIADARCAEEFYGPAMLAGLRQARRYILLIGHGRSRQLIQRAKPQAQQHGQ